MEKKGRHELKHYINYADYLQLHARLPYISKQDKNVGEDGTYRVRSLYFDNYMDKALREKLDGINIREKFRIRLYNGDTSFIRLEKKSKKNGFCYKESAVIQEEECRALLNGDYSVLKKNGNPLLLELYTKMHYQQLRPKNIVDYKREAYVLHAGNVRITIDSDIRGSSSVRQFLDKDMITIPIPNATILEVKYDEFLPEIMRNITALPSRKATAFSKYAMTRIV